MSWTDDRVETLKRMWGEGASASTIAKALGGQVGPNPQGWVKGALTVRYGTETQAAYASHTEQVLAAPHGAEVVAKADGCPIAGFALPGVETTQYHPEMTPEFFAALLDEYGPSLPKEVLSAARASLDLVPDRRAWAERIATHFETVAAGRERA